MCPTSTAASAIAADGAVYHQHHPHGETHDSTAELLAIQMALKFLVDVLFAQVVVPVDVHMYRASGSLQWCLHVQRSFRTDSIAGGLRFLPLSV